MEKAQNGGGRPGWVALKTDQLQSTCVTSVGCPRQLRVIGSGSHRGVATLWNVSILFFFLNSVLTSLNYLFFFKAYLRVDSSLSRWHCLSSNILLCFLVLQKGWGLKPAFRELCTSLGMPTGVCSHTIHHVCLCKVLELPVWRSPRLGVSMTNSVPIWWWLRSSLSEPAAYPHA